MHFRAILLCKRLHRQLALELPPPLLYLLYITEGDKDDNTLFGFYQYTKAK